MYIDNDQSSPFMAAIKPISATVGVVIIAALILVLLMIVVKQRAAMKRMYGILFIMHFLAGCVLL